MDNTTEVAHIPHGLEKSQNLMKISRGIWEFCFQRGIILTTEFICQADRESRLTESSSDWILNRSVFNQINRVTGPLSAQLSNYVSWRPDPFAALTDVFQMN